ncbi:histidine utilization repressor [Brevundimonas sp.]|uniref:histidine utilization repressor n=1 Tax=Brevundimonas sp. TaxID=1871086 RepID=UPI002ED9619C
MDLTLHRRIRSDIADRILSGEWSPGFRIPFEHELMLEYGCSRMTVNKALAPLAERGMIIRRRRFGSFVARPRIHSVVLDIPDIQAEILNRGEPYDFELLSRKVRAAHKRDAEELALAASGEVIELRCLHRSSGRPFALEERLISLASVPQARDADFTEVPPGTWLLERVPWTEAEHRIRAVNVSRATALILGVDPAAACLSLERRTWRRAERITFVRMTFPGEAYDLGARFAQSDPAEASDPGVEPAAPDR